MFRVGSFPVDTLPEVDASVVYHTFHQTHSSSYCAICETTPCQSDLGHLYRLDLQGCAVVVPNKVNAMIKEANRRHVCGHPYEHPHQQDTQCSMCKVPRVYWFSWSSKTFLTCHLLSTHTHDVNPAKTLGNHLQALKSSLQHHVHDCLIWSPHWIRVITDQHRGRPGPFQQLWKMIQSDDMSYRNIQYHAHQCFHQLEQLISYSHISNHDKKKGVLHSMTAPRVHGGCMGTASFFSPHEWLLHLDDIGIPQHLLPDSFTLGKTFAMTLRDPTKKTECITFHRVIPNPRHINTIRVTDITQDQKEGDGDGDLLSPLFMHIEDIRPYRHLFPSYRGICAPIEITKLALYWAPPSLQQPCLTFSDTLLQTDKQRKALDERFLSLPPQPALRRQALVLSKTIKEYQDQFLFGYPSHQDPQRFILRSMCFPEWNASQGYWHRLSPPPVKKGPWWETQDMDQLLVCLSTLNPLQVKAIIKQHGSNHPLLHYIMNNYFHEDGRLSAPLTVCRKRIYEAHDHLHHAQQGSSRMAWSMKLRQIHPLQLLSRGSELQEGGMWQRYMLHHFILRDRPSEALWSQRVHMVGRLYSPAMEKVLKAHHHQVYQREGLSIKGHEPRAPWFSFLRTFVSHAKPQVIPCLLPRDTWKQFTWSYSFIIDAITSHNENEWQWQISSPCWYRLPDMMATWIQRHASGIVHLEWQGERQWVDTHDQVIRVWTWEDLYHEISRPEWIDEVMDEIESVQLTITIDPQSIQHPTEQQILKAAQVEGLMLYYAYECSQQQWKPHAPLERLSLDLFPDQVIHQIETWWSTHQPCPHPSGWAWGVLNQWGDEKQDPKEDDNDHQKDNPMETQPHILLHPDFDSSTLYVQWIYAMLNTEATKEDIQCLSQCLASCSKELDPISAMQLHRVSQALTFLETPSDQVHEIVNPIHQCLLPPQEVPTTHT
jgi:hypothetical protein